MNISLLEPIGVSEAMIEQHARRFKVKVTALLI